MLEYLRYFLPLPVSTPIYLIQFVTSKCMGRCRHCFYWRDLNRPEDPLTPSEYYRIATHMGPVLQWLLTGGEPYLRRDFDELVRAFYRGRKPFNIAIATSGYFPDRVVKSAETLLFDCPRSNFIFGLPIEGPSALNDNIRGVKGFFDRTAAAIGELKTLKRSLRPSVADRLTILVDITLSRLNEDTVEETYRLVRDELKPDVINLIMTRGEARDATCAGPSVNVFRDVNRMINRDLRDGRVRGYGGFTSLVNAKDALLRRQAADTREDRGDYFRCAAGRLACVIMPEGDVMGCELLPDRFGNLRDHDYEMRRIWKSASNREFRRRVHAERCRCVHQCFLSPTLFFNPLGQARMAAGWLRGEI